MVNVVGDHAVHHAPLDAPLASDIESVARPVSHWLRERPRRPRPPPADAAEAVAAARSRGGGVATLIVPADAGWSRRPARPPPLRVAPPAAVPEARGRGRGPRAALAASRRRCCSAAPPRAGPRLRAAARIAAATGARLIHDTFPARLERGAGIPRAQPLPYLTEMATEALAGLRPPRGRRHPGAGRRSSPTPASPAAWRPRHRVARARRPARGHGRRAGGARGAVGAPAAAAAAGRATPGAARAPPAGALDRRRDRRRDRGRCCPRGRSSSTSPSPPPPRSCRPRRAPRRTTGSRSRAARSARACPSRPAPPSPAPDRPVLSLEGDGSAMYTIQSLWTQAREGLDVTTVIFANRSYAILDFELSRVGAEARGPAARGAVRDRPAGPRLRRAGAEHGRARTARRGRGELHGRAARGPRRARARG